MSLNAYLWGVRLFTLLSLCAWFGVIMAVDPEQAGFVGIGLFFTSLFAFLLGGLTLCFTFFYRKVLGEESAAHYLGSIFRQAFLLASYVCIIIFFQWQQILTWWDFLLLLAAVLLVEFSFRELSREGRTDH